MAVKAILASSVEALGWTYSPLAVRVVGFDRYGRGFSNIQFSASSILREYNRLKKLGYAVGLVDHGENWLDSSTVAEIAAQQEAKRLAA